MGAQLKMVAQRRNIARAEIGSLLIQRLESVGLKDTKRILACYPHQLSGECYNDA